MKSRILGQASVSGDTAIHTFLWQNGVMNDLGVLPGDAGSGAFGLNDQGQVVGGSCGPSVTLEFGCRAYLWTHGVMLDPNTLVNSTPLYLVFGNDINSQGEIAAYAFDQSNGEFHAALAIPCDERHASDQDCQDAARSAVGFERPRAVLPENVREMLQRRMRFPRF